MAYILSSYEVEKDEVNRYDYQERNTIFFLPSLSYYVSVSRSVCVGSRAFSIVSPVLENDEANWSVYSPLHGTS